MLLTQLHEIKKKENETVKEFDDRLRKLVDNVTNKIRPSDDAILMHYTNAYDRHFGLMLRDKFSTTLESVQDWASKIEENMLSTKVDPLGSSRAPTSKEKTKPRAMNTIKPSQDPILALNEKFEKLSTDLIQSQKTILNRMISLEREKGQLNAYQ
jgi:hypothetical protein